MQLHLSDNMAILKAMDDNSIDSIVTDPPYGLGKEPNPNILLREWLEFGYSEVKGKGFMGKEWDAFVPQPNFWKECFRVLKPGGHVLSFYGTRTYDWGVLAMRLAGFEIRDCVMWVYGSGFPKSLNIGKAIDKLQGNEREVVGKDKSGSIRNCMGGDFKGGEYSLSKGNTEWEGWGSSLKPAVEPIVLARKPIAMKSIAENVLKYGTGGINIDGCKVATEDDLNGGAYSGGTRKDGDWALNSGFKNDNESIEFQQTNGRFPANLIIDGSDEVVAGFPETTSEGHWSKSKVTGFGEFGGGTYEYGGVGEKDKNGGSASRFFYTAKAHSSERNRGLEGFEEKRNSKYGNNGYSSASPTFAINSNFHPTVKPIDLMRYLVRLITPKGAVCLDPFMGSGTTGMACKLEGMEFIGIEQDKEYFAIAKARIDSVGEVTEIRENSTQLF